MRIRDNTLHIHDVKLYGCNGNTFSDYEEMAGCPYLYKLKLEGKEKITKSYELTYGSMFHKILWAIEKEGITPDEALKKYYDKSTGTKGWEEADTDLQKWLKRSEPNFTSLDEEVYLKIPLFEHNGEIIWFGGTLDRVEYIASDPSKIYFRDFKTDRSPRSKAQLNKDIQFTAYDVLLDENIERFTDITGQESSEVQIVGILDMIKFYTLYTSRSRAQKDRFKAWITSMAYQILDDEKGEPKLNSSCGYCHLRYECIEFQKAIENGEGYLVDFSNSENIEERVRIMHKMMKLVTLMNKVIDSVKEELIVKPGTYDGVTYEKNKKSRKYIDKEQLHKILGDNFYRIVDISIRKLSNYISDNPDKEALINSITKEIFDGWVLSKSK